MSKCAFIKASGEACKALPMKGEQWCYTHHPAKVEKRRRDGSKGGRRGGRGRPVVEVQRITARLEQLADDVLAGQVDKADGAVVGQLLNYCLRGLSVGLKAREQLELEERLTELETALERQKEGSSYGYAR